SPRARATSRIASFSGCTSGSAIAAVAPRTTATSSCCPASIRAMDETRLMIVADVFEDGSGVPASLQRLGAQVVVEPLPAGDYRISGGALVERKTVADLHGSLARGRLWSQIGRIRDAAALPFLF